MADPKTKITLPDISSAGLVSVYDELPLWSSYFGAVLLEQIPLKKDSVILDIGCGTGFPLIEIAQRSGGGSRITGIDPWNAALERIKKKLELMSINNVVVIEGIAEALPFENNHFDLIVSNNGINNVKDSGKVIKEAFRVTKNGGKLIFTVNLPGTMAEFYAVFRETLIELKLSDYVVQLENHIFSKRKTLQMNIDMITGSGFWIENIITDQFRMRFTGGSALFNHFFIKLAFMESWQNIVPQLSRDKFFNFLEARLNQVAESEGELNLTIPFACFSCKKEF